MRAIQAYESQLKLRMLDGLLSLPRTHLYGISAHDRLDERDADEVRLAHEEAQVSAGYPVGLGESSHGAASWLSGR